MNSRIIDWVQTLTGVAVLIGVGLVVWEQHQARELARLQLVADSWSDRTALIRTHLSEDYSKTRAKACLHPEQLTPEEVLEVISYNQLLIHALDRQEDHKQIGDGVSLPLEVLAEVLMGEVLSTDVGIAQFRTSMSEDPRLGRIGNTILNGDTLVNCEQSLKPILESLKPRKGVDD